MLLVLYGANSWIEQIHEKVANFYLAHSCAIWWYGADYVVL
jgi:hypothetical protein